MIRESLIGSDVNRSVKQSFHKIYKRIKAKYHLFFFLMIGTLVFRTFSYMRIRMDGAFTIEPLRENEISPTDTVLLAIQEAAMNIVLLCYFYGIDLRDKQKDDHSFEHSIVDGLAERASEATKKAHRGKQSSIYQN